MQGSIGFTGTLSGQIDDSGSGGTSNYNELTNKPSINGVPLVGNKTTEDLHLFSGDYDDLSDKPSVNGITLSGNKTTADLGLFSGNYNDLTNKPNLFSGDYNDLTNKPTLFSGDYNDLTNKPTLFDGDYDSLSSRPRINGNLLTGNKTTADLGLFSGNYNDLTNKPTLFSGDYNDLTNKPTIPEVDANPSGATTEEMDDIEVDGTVYEVVDAAARGIIGDGQLDPGFTATDLTGAANELKSNIGTLNSSKARIQDAVTSSSSTTVEFDASDNQCYILLSYYRSSAVSTSDGIVFIKVYNNVAYISCKLQANDITSISFNGTTNKLTITVGSYRSCRLIG